MEEVILRSEDSEVYSDAHESGIFSLGKKTTGSRPSLAELFLQAEEGGSVNESGGNEDRGGTQDPVAPLQVIQSFIR